VERNKPMNDCWGRGDAFRQLLGEMLRLGNIVPGSIEHA
jgi:hypothetical protein